MDFTVLLKESFHTYQLYLECNHVINDKNIKMSLLKWPDVAQSAISYAKALESGNLKDSIVANELLKNDLIAAMIMPVKSIYDAACQRVEDLLGKPSLNKVNPSEKPVVLKRNYIVEINNMFKVLETMTGIKYPVLQEFKDESNS